MRKRPPNSFRTKLKEREAEVPVPPGCRAGWWGATACDAQGAFCHLFLHTVRSEGGALAGRRSSHAETDDSRNRIEARQADSRSPPGIPSEARATCGQDSGRDRQAQISASGDSDSRRFLGSAGMPGSATADVRFPRRGTRSYRSPLPESASERSSGSPGRTGEPDSSPGQRPGGSPALRNRPNGRSGSGWSRRRKAESVGIGFVPQFARSEDGTPGCANDVVRSGIPAPRIRIVSHRRAADSVFRTARGEGTQARTPGRLREPSVGRAAPAERFSGTATETRTEPSCVGDPARAGASGTGA